MYQTRLGISNKERMREINIFDHARDYAWVEVYSTYNYNGVA